MYGISSIFMMFAPPCVVLSLVFFFFNDAATTEIYTLSLHDALPIFLAYAAPGGYAPLDRQLYLPEEDRKSTRLNSSHVEIAYAVFCLKKKKSHCRTYLATRKKTNRLGLRII